MLCFIVSSPTPTHAQSIFQTLFGFSKPASPRSPSPKKRNPTLQYYGGPTGIKNQPFYNGRNPRNNQSNRRYHAYGSYRTVCVRSCDGYYFPISSSASRARFRKDARSCQSRCGTAAELYYLPRRSDNMKEARNLSGRSYADLENAFKYRKKLVNGCACRPMPWSHSERARHRRYEYVAAVERSYALAEALAKKRREQEAAQIAKAQEDARKAQTLAFVERTQNIRNGSDSQSGTLILAPSSNDFQDRWIEESRRYAAPYYIYLLRQQQNPSKTLENIASQRNDPQIISSLSAQSEGHMASFTFSANQYALTRATKNSKPRSLVRSHKRRVKRRKKKNKKSNIAFGGLFNQKQSQYRWPGD